MKGDIYMKDKLQAIKDEALKSIEEAKDLKILNDIRVNYLGKKGELTGVLRGMKDLSNEERPVIGQLANEVRNIIEETLEGAKTNLAKIERERKLTQEVIDVTMPAKKQEMGHRHPMNIVLDDIKAIFMGMGYEIAEGPEVEKDYYNFEALNIPENHPAKDEQDTFYINKDTVLRTQTSPVQIRVMENSKPPIRVIAPGRVYRSDEVDASHSPVFNQIEGLVIDKNITMADLKGALEVFIKELYGEKVKVKFRPHHFPFTEPSAEVDVSCVMCGGEGCRVCKGSGWIEILGCGMVHPKVLEMVGIDSKEYSGFAFGMGLERITMLRYGIKDIRLFYENDVRFLQQF
jgi:phenylalanyl-tRNA synthetase alpha chain